MTERVKSLSFSNSAVLYDEIFVMVSMVLDHGWPAGPAFLHSLATLTEALVIHDKVLYDPFRDTEQPSESGGTVSDIIRQSDFVQELVKEEALTLFPPHDEVDNLLKSRGVDYEMIDFVVEGKWGSASFIWGDPATESTRYEILLDLLREAPSVLAATEFIGADFGPVGFEIKDTSMFSALQLGFSRRDLETIESLNRRSAALLELALFTGTNVYPVYQAVPHELGAQRARNSLVRRIYESVAERVEAVDTPVGHADFVRVPIPPLCQIALARCKGSDRALAHEILALRERHQKFRGYLTEFERAWNAAATRAERRKLQLEWEGAWSTLVAREDRPKGGKVSRILGFLWDVSKSVTPKGALSAGGDKVVASGRERSIVRRVKGLHDFYRELSASPTSDRNRELVANTFHNRADDDVWSLAADVAVATNAALLRSDPSNLVEPPPASKE